MAHWWILPNNQEKTNTNPSHTLPEIFTTAEEERTPPYSFYYMRPVYPYTDTDKSQENYKLIPLININSVIFNKILENWVYKYIKRILHDSQVGFI